VQGFSCKTNSFTIYSWMILVIDEWNQSRAFLLGAFAFAGSCVTHATSCRAHDGTRSACAMEDFVDKPFRSNVFHVHSK
jgi:hypothetical protein